MFPRRLSLRGPISSEMVSRFDEVRAWIGAVRHADPCRIEMRSFRHPELGTNAVPVAAWIDSFDDAVEMIGKRREADRFAKVLETTRRQQPEWLSWLARKPMVGLGLANEWDRFLDIANWCRQHPRSGLYLRQVDLPGVHTKFIEAHRGVLTELLDLALPGDAVDRDASGAARFGARYGFLEKPVRVRFRILDAGMRLAWPGDDMTITADAFAVLDPPAARIFITENEINFLAFPPVEGSLIIFGAGYGLESLQRADWLKRRRIYYWGDIDTHGFVILDQLRRCFAHVSSMLMDQETFVLFCHLWGREQAPVSRDLATLTPAEHQLYNDLRDNRFGQHLRLEQEQIAFSRVQAVVAELMYGAGD